MAIWSKFSDQLLIRASQTKEKHENGCVSINNNRNKTTKPTSMILASFFSEGDALSDATLLNGNVQKIRRSAFFFKDTPCSRNPAGHSQRLLHLKLDYPRVEPLVVRRPERDEARNVGGV